MATQLPISNQYDSGLQIPHGVIRRAQGGEETSVVRVTNHDQRVKLA